MWLPVTVWFTGARHDVYVETTGPARVADLAKALGGYLGLASAPALSTEAGVSLAAGAGLVEAGIRAGTVLRASGDHAAAGGLTSGGGSVHHDSRTTVSRQLRVVDGPDAGLVVSLPGSGTLTIGRSADNEVYLTAHAVSRRHASLQCEPDAVRLVDTGSANGSTVGGVAVKTPMRLTDGVPIQIGADRLVMEIASGEAPRTGAHLAPISDGRIRFVRPHRYVPPEAPVVVEVPAPAAEMSVATGTVGIGAISGLALGVVGYLVSHNLTFLVFSMVSTVTLLGTGGYAWWRQRGKRSRAARGLASRQTAYGAKVAELLAAERERRLGAAPGVTDVLATAVQAEQHLWERRPGHDDFLRVRLGVADLPSTIEIRNPAGTRADDQPRFQQPTLPGVPLTIDLTAVGTLGLSGRHAQTRAIARWILAQAVTQCGPADLSVVVLTSGADEPAVAWDWVRWLPHARSQPGGPIRLGNDPTTIAAQVEELAGIVSTRRRPAGEPPVAGSRRFAHYWLLVIDDLPEHDVPGLADVLAYGPDTGVFVVAIGALPYRCPVAVTFTDSSRLHVREPGRDVTQVQADLLNATVAERLARGLAPLADPEQRSGQAVLPAQVALLDLVPTTDPAEVLARWAQAPRATSTVLGTGPSGPVVIDIAESGPHLLIAGATGWGKSELLRALVGGLALANRPDQLGLILVDFKGGAAFAPFAALPHTVDTITNLDGHQVMRALESLSGEMARRQRYLAAVGVDKLEDYQRLADAGTLPPGCPRTLPRLLVVIDEFAKLRDDLPPEILSRLVHVATQGRSLGLHLVIGTQTPRGSVPAEIRPNVNVHIALHLTAEHSSDVIGVPDASGLAVKGRAYLRRGEEAELTLFQSAFLGGVREPASPPVRIHPVAWPRLGYPPPAHLGATVRDIDLLVGVVRAAARDGDLHGPDRPWLPELPAIVSLESLEAPAGGIGPHPPGLADAAPQPQPIVLRYAREDHPEQRAQPAAVWDLRMGTHLLAAGQPKSGRTTLLRTLAASVAAYRTDEVRLYVLDCGGALADLAVLPHCGAVVGRGETYRATRLLDRLEQMTERAPEDRSHTIVMIDDWDTWLQSIGDLDAGARYDQLVRIARKGPSVGIHLAVTGTSALLSGGRARALVEAAMDRLALPFDRAEYGFLGVPSTAVPAAARPGQAVRIGEAYRTVQVAIVGNDPQPAAQVAALRTVAERAAARLLPGMATPWRIEALPDRITRRQVRTGPAGPAATPATLVSVGVGGDTLTPACIDLVAQGPGLAIAGDPRTGRSNLLLGIALDLLEAGLRVVALAPGRTSTLRQLVGVPGVAAVLTAPTPTARQAQLAIAAAGSHPHVILVDDAEMLLRTEVDAVLRDRLRGADRHTVGIVIATSPDAVGAPAAGTFVADVTRGARVVLLAPRSARLQLLGGMTRLPESYLGGGVVGRAVLVGGSEHLLLQVPLVDSDDVPPAAAARAVALLQVTDALAGDGPSLAQLTSIVDELRAAGFDALDDAAARRAVDQAPQWTRSPAALVEAVQG